MSACALVVDDLMGEPGAGGTCAIVIIVTSIAVNTVNLAPLVAVKVENPEGTLVTANLLLCPAHRTRKHEHLTSGRVHRGAQSESGLRPTHPLQILTHLRDGAMVDGVSVEVGELVLVALAGEDEELAGSWVEEHGVADSGWNLDRREAITAHVTGSIVSVIARDAINRTVHVHAITYTCPLESGQVAAVQAGVDGVLVGAGQESTPKHPNAILVLIHDHLMIVDAPRSALSPHIRTQPRPSGVTQGISVEIAGEVQGVALLGVNVSAEDVDVCGGGVEGGFVAGACGGAPFRLDIHGNEAPGVRGRGE